MLAHQFEESLPVTELKSSRVLPLWLFSRDSPIKEICPREVEAANELPHKRSKQYQHARGNVRSALSDLFNINPLEIPLDSPPGKAPILRNELGNISFSHCNDALLLGWSPNKIGIDIERTDRSFDAKRLANRFFNEDDRHELLNLNKEQLRLKVLEKWIEKEALIKWQKGSMARDLREWSINQESSIAIHRSLNYQVSIYKLKYKSWSISIASNQKLDHNHWIICEE